MEQLRINGIPEKTRAQTEWAVRVWKDLDWASEKNSKSTMLAIIPIDFVEAARILVGCIPVLFCRRKDSSL